jgi:hypothetical protein
MLEMHSTARPRQYVSPARLYAMLPLLRFSYERGAYILRFVGETKGPVLRKDRRRRHREFDGYDRREGGVDPTLASRPMGSVRRIEAPGRDAEGAGAPRRAAERTQAPRRDAGTTGAASLAPDTSGRPQRAEANRRRRQHGRQRPPRPHH